MTSHAFQLTGTGDCVCGEALKHESHLPHPCPTPRPAEHTTGDSWRCDCSQLWERTEEGWVRSEVIHGLDETPQVFSMDLFDRFWSAAWPDRECPYGECGKCKFCGAKFALNWTYNLLSNPDLAAKAEELGRFPWLNPPRGADSPVDREALREQMIEAISARLHITTDTVCDGGKPRHLSADTAAVWEAADAVLAVLAGEQEQVER